MASTTKQKPRNRGEYTMAQFPRSLQGKLGMVASATRENRPDVIERLLGPVLDAELRRLANGSTKSKS